MRLLIAYADLKVKDTNIPIGPLNGRFAEDLRHHAA